VGVSLQGVPELSYGRRVPLAPGNPDSAAGLVRSSAHFRPDPLAHGRRFSDHLREQAPNLRTDLEVEDLLLVNGKMTDGTTFLLDLPGRGWRNA